MTTGLTQAAGPEPAADEPPTTALSAAMPSAAAQSGAQSGRPASTAPEVEPAVSNETGRGVAPLRIALSVEDPALADQIAALLADVPGLDLVRDGAPADAILVAPPDRTDRIPRGAAADPEVTLTPREREVLALLAEGASNKAIARRLGISVHTAKFHVGAVIDKLDAVGRTDAVAHAARLGVIHL